MLTPVPPFSHPESSRHSWRWQTWAIIAAACAALALLSIDWMNAYSAIPIASSVKFTTRGEQRLAAAQYTTQEALTDLTYHHLSALEKLAAVSRGNMVPPTQWYFANTSAHSSRVYLGGQPLLLEQNAGSPIVLQQPVQYANGKSGTWILEWYQHRWQIVF